MQRLVARRELGNVMGLAPHSSVQYRSAHLSMCRHSTVMVVRQSVRSAFLLKCSTVTRQVLERVEGALIEGPLLARCCLLPPAAMGFCRSGFLKHAANSTKDERSIYCRP